jgi:methylase of polypeptide subunit release factors
MPGPTSSSPLALDRPDDMGRVRDVLDRAGFDDRRVRGRLGVGKTADLDFGPLDRPRVLRRTRDGDPLSSLIRLFVAGVPVPLDAFRRAVAPMDPADWAELGLVELEGDDARRSVMLLPNEGFLIAHDAVLPDGSIRRDHVLGVSDSTRAFSSMIVRPPARRTLDLGTGSGYLALRAAAHSQHVLATDVNPRAVAMARFNAMLNRIHNVEIAEGNLFEPTGDLRFDLIASNPPFVVSPQDDLVYRDSGLQGDAFCERIFRAVPGHLAEGGFAQVICNWVRIAGQDWLERLAAWFDGAECDVWIIHARSTTPGEYAQQWLTQGDRSRAGRFADAFERWMNYYDQHRIEAIDGGLITLRRRSGGRNWIRVDTDRERGGPDGAGILAGFAGRDLLDGLDDGRAVMELRLLCPPEVRVSQRLRPTGSGWMVDRADGVLGAGPRFEGELNPIVFHLLTLCRGHLPLSDVLAQAAARVGTDVETIREECLDAVRTLVLQGFLRPVDPALGPVDASGATR